MIRDSAISIAVSFVVGTATCGLRKKRSSSVRMRVTESCRLPEISTDADMSEVTRYESSEEHVTCRLLSMRERISDSRDVPRNIATRL